MILYIASNISGIGLQTQYFKNFLTDSGVVFDYLDPHKLFEDDWSLEYSKSGSILRCNDKAIDPKVIYMSTPWRTDAVINLSSQIKYPNLSRRRLEQFMQDIRFAFDDRLWLPGTIESQERSESKISLFRIAKQIGLNVPDVTVNSRSPKKFFSKGKVYQKGLGFPVVISLNSEIGEEVCITTTNSATGNNCNEEDDYWQWQSVIHSDTQIRCQFVGDKCWAVKWNRLSETEDLRERFESEEGQIFFEDFEIPRSCITLVQLLMEKLKVKMASPEFLIDKKGRMVLIDFNTCGEWFGFFEHNRNSIAREILNLATS